MLALQTTIGEAVRNVALGDPISTVLFALGALLTGGAIAAFGLLALGAAIDVFVPE